MKLTVKTLKGAKFVIDVDDSHTVEQVKAAIEKTKSELPAAGMKLIHSGKVLKDADAISECGIQPNDFLVVMVTKPKKPAAAAAAAAAPTAAAATPAATPAKEEAKSPAAAATAGADAAAPAASAAASTPASSAATAAAAAAPGAPARTTSEPEVSAEAVESLMSMGFPEAEVRHCLRAAGNNPDVAIEFLTNGIPDVVTSALEQAAAAGTGAAASSAASTSPVASGSSAGQPPLQSLRNHPQFDNLRRLVQSNPAMLQQVLTQIGQQQPELLAEINGNQGLFLEMMNEPVGPAPEGASSSAAGSGGAAAAAARGAPGGAGAGGGLGFGSPGQMASLISSMGNDELQQMASMMGISVEQLRQTANLIGSMPEAELNQFMMQAMGGGYGGGMDDDDIMGGGGGGGGGGFGGPQVVRLTEEEMAAVDRLTEMGFDRSDAAQAFLACDKNEAMAANLLMDSMGDGGGAFFGGGPGDDDNNNDNNNNNQGDMDDDADDMYD